MTAMMALIKEANRKGVKIAFDKNQLALNIPKGKRVEQGIIDKIKANKIALKEYFQTHFEKGIDKKSISAFLANYPKPDTIPLSYSQERLWFIDQLGGSTQYHQPIVLQLTGFLDERALEASFKMLLTRHTVLRTIYHENSGKPYQKVQSVENWNLKVTSLKTREKGRPEEAYIAKIVREPFDLASDYMMRAELVRFGNSNYILTIVIHHIASDGWSFPILVKELVEQYKAETSGVPSTLPLLPIQYADYAVWLRGNLDKEVLADKMRYWENKLKAVEPFELSGDFPRPPIQSTRGTMEGSTYPVQLLDKLTTISKQEGVTLYMTLLAAFKILLFRYTGEEDICVGTSVANRTLPELEHLIGFFVNSLALRDELDNAASFLTTLQQVRKTVLDAHKHQDVPFEKVVNKMGQNRDLGRSPLFQILFSFQNNEKTTNISLDKISIKTYPVRHTTTLYDLTFNVSQVSRGIHVSVEYCSDLYTPSTIKRLLRHYGILLQSIANEPSQRIDRLDLLNQKEADLVRNLSDCVNKKLESQSIIPYIDRQLQWQSNLAAVYDEYGEMSYEELFGKVNALSLYLTSNYMLKEEELIGLMMKNSRWTIVSLLSIMKLGLAYLPIDIRYPKDRVNYMIKDARLRIVLTDPNFMDDGFGSNIEFIDVQNRLKEVESEFPIPKVEFPTLKADQLAYVIYTSGSTGSPKGVMIEHEALLNYVQYCLNTYQVNGEAMHFPLFTSIAFDLTQTSVLLPLLTGGTIHVSGEENLMDALHATISAGLVTHIKLTPSHTRLLDGVQSIRLTAAIVGGEALKSNHIERLYAVNPEMRIFNEYGPTEATIGCCVFELEQEEGIAIPIGRPIWNAQLSILDAHDKEIPIGMVGELHIAGMGLARGYLNQPVMTADKFKYLLSAGHDRKRYYGTGDLARWLPDGNIEYLGRRDDQIKLRGHRIELGEIEYALGKHPNVRNSSVVVMEREKGIKVLAAYLETEKPLDKNDMKAFLKKKLPVYAIPDFVCELPQIPLTENGKVNKKALMLLGNYESQKKVYEAPSTSFEKEMTLIYEELLNLQDIGINDNFFELGGDSITAIQVVSRVKKLGYPIHPKDLFRYQTIKELSDRIVEERYRKMAKQKIKKGNFPLLPIQKRAMASVANKGVAEYHVVSLKTVKSIRRDIIDESVGVLCRHHDTLRMEFTYEDGDLVQFYGKEVKGVVVEQYARATTTAKEILRLHTTNLANEDQLVGFVLLEEEGDEDHNELFVLIHSAIVDNISLVIVKKDLEDIIFSLSKGKNIRLPSKTYAFHDWYDALSTYAERDIVTSQIDYWRSIVQAEHGIPREKKRANKINASKCHSISLMDSFSDAFTQNLNLMYHTRTEDLLLSAMAMALGEWFGEVQLLFGVKMDKVRQIDEELKFNNTVGCFSFVYPVLVSIDPSEPIAQTIKRIKEQLSRVPYKGIGHQALRISHPSEEVRNELTVGNYDIVYNYREHETERVARSAVSSFDAKKGLKVPEEKIVLNLLRKNDCLQLTIEYDSDQYYSKSIRSLASLYKKNLQKLAQHCVSSDGEFPTPSDFGLEQEVTFQELDHFYANGANKDEISHLSKLSPLQEGMLFQSLYGGTIYVEQMVVDFPLDINLDAVEYCWRRLFEHHSILRTCFFHDRFSIPVQAVYKSIVPLVQKIDFSHFLTAELKQEIRALVRSEKEKGFELSKPPLLRILLVKVNESAYKLVLTSHHILLDGWSMGLLIDEFLEHYRSFESGQMKITSETDHYTDFIHFLDQGDKYKEWSFWKAYLKDIDQRANIPFLDYGQKTSRGDGDYQHTHLSIDEEFTKEITSYARSGSITVNTLMQGIWALLLYKYKNSATVTFGVTVSGRPAGLENIEKRVGLYINMIPLHTAIVPGHNILSWLVSLQQEHVLAREYQYTSVGKLRQLLGFQGDLFESVLIFQNAPKGETIGRGQTNLQMSGTRRVPSEYPLNIDFLMADRLNIQFTYNQESLSARYIEMIKTDFHSVLKELVLERKKRISDLSLLAGRDRIRLNATFTIDPIRPYLTELMGPMPDRPLISYGEYNQVLQELNNPRSALYAYPDQVNYIFLRWRDSYRYEEDGAKTTIASKQEKVHQFRDDLLKGVQSNRNRLNGKIHFIICPVANEEVEDALAMKTFLAEVNTDFAHRISELMDSEVTFAEDYGPIGGLLEKYDHVQDKLGHIPYTEEMYGGLGVLVGRTYFQHSLNRLPKVIVLDCDNTLWQGILGEDGMEGIHFDDHRVNFHRSLKRLKSEGILLAMSSKNNEEEVLDLFSRLDEIKKQRGIASSDLLSLQDFVGWEINWEPKSKNIMALADSLNLGLESFVFIDDSALECREVREHCPEVFTLQLPASAALVGSFIDTVWCFKKGGVTAEDHRRTQMYQEERLRKSEESSSDNYASFLANLDINIKVNALSTHSVERASQLTKRTNQFNTNKVPYSTDALESYAAQPDHRVEVVSVSDKFGDYGTVAVLIYKKEKQRVLVDHFLMSCRVLGRNIEYRLLEHLTRFAEEAGAQNLLFAFHPTNRNAPARRFLETLGSIGPEGNRPVPLVDIPLLLEESLAYSKENARAVEKKAKTPSTASELWLRYRLQESVLENMVTHYPTLTALFDRTKAHHTKHHKVREAYVAPRNGIERVIIKIWEHLLHVQDIGIHDDFFLLGGHSLLATRLASAIQKELQISVELKQLFEYTTVETLSVLISKLLTTRKYPPIVSRIRPAKIPLSFYQEKVWFMHQWMGSQHQHIPAALNFEGTLNPDHLKKSFETVLGRHEILRTVYTTQNGMPCQVLFSSNKLVFKVHGLKKGSSDTLLEAAINEEINEPFDLQCDVPVRSKLLSLNDTRHIFVLVFHSIAFDKFAVRLFLKEVISTYMKLTADPDYVYGEPPTVQHADFVLWEREYWSNDRLATEIGNIKSELAVNVPASDLSDIALGIPYGDEHTTTVCSKSTIGKSVYGQLVELGRKTNTPLPTIILSMYRVFLSLIFSPVYLRIKKETAHTDLRGAIGPYGDTFLVPNTIDLANTFYEIIGTTREIVKTNGMMAPPHIKTIEAIGKDNPKGNGPMSEICFEWQDGRLFQTVHHKDTSIQDYPIDDKNRISGFALEVTDLDKSELEIAFKALNSLFAEKDLERLLGQFKSCMEEMLRAPDTAVQDLSQIMKINSTNKTVSLERNSFIGNKTQVILESHCPDNPLETKLLQFWRNIVQAQEIGIHDHFFQLGTSVQVLEYIRVIEKEFHLNVPVKHFMDNPTIHSLAKYIAIMTASIEMDDEQEFLIMDL